MPTQLTIVVSAMLGEVPGQGGWAWAVLQYLLGLKQLGHRILFVDTLSRAKLSQDVPLSESVNAKYFTHVLEPYGLMTHSSLILQGTRETVGLKYDQALEVGRHADV